LESVFVRGVLFERDAVMMGAATGRHPQERKGEGAVRFPP
jgi:hypothetical protein